MSKKYTDISIDIETFSNNPRALIVSIGAVAFVRDNPENGGCETFEVHVDFDDQVASREINASTLMWWLNQSQAARKGLIDGQKEALSLFDAMRGLDLFIRSNCNLNDVRVWGNGASFDNAILSDAFSQCKVPIPWKFWNDRCLRTLLGEFQEVTGRKLKDEVQFAGVRHSALSDALHQANLVITATAERPTLGGN